jgi:hypothetical protein
MRTEEKPVTSLSQREEASLELFMQRLHEVLESSVVKNPPKALFTMSETIFGDTSKPEVIFNGYDEVAFLAFFTTFRQFTMEKEKAVYFDKVCEIILDKCDREELTKWIRYSKSRWDRLLGKKPIVQFVLDGESYTNRKLLKLWLYSGRFHTDIDKADRWNSFPETMRYHAEMSVQALIPELVNCVVIVGSVIRWWRQAITELVPPVPAA